MGVRVNKTNRFLPQLASFDSERNGSWKWSCIILPASIPTIHSGVCIKTMCHLHSFSVLSLKLLFKWVKLACMALKFVVLEQILFSISR